MSDCLILTHSQGKYLADNLQDDSIDVVYESGQRSAKDQASLCIVVHST